MTTELRKGQRVRFSFVGTKGFPPTGGTGTIIGNHGRKWLVKRDNHWSEHDCLALRDSELRPLPAAEDCDTLF